MFANKEKFTILIGPKRFGKTVKGLKFLLNYLLQTPKAKALFVIPSCNRHDMVHDIICRFLPDQDFIRCLYKTSIEFYNGSILKISTPNNSVICGSTYDYVFIDDINLYNFIDIKNFITNCMIPAKKIIFTSRDNNSLKKTFSRWFPIPKMLCSIKAQNGDTILKIPNEYIHISKPSFFNSIIDFFRNARR